MSFTLRIFCAFFHNTNSRKKIPRRQQSTHALIHTRRCCVAFVCCLSRDPSQLNLGRSAWLCRHLNCPFHYFSLISLRFFVVVFSTHSPRCCCCNGKSEFDDVLERLFCVMKNMHSDSKESSSESIKSGRLLLRSLLREAQCN